MPLAIWTAVVHRRLRRLGRLGVNAPGPGIALIGGTLASASMALCALFGWAASRSGGLGDAPLTRTLHDLVFATGGPGHVVPFGLLLAGVVVPLWRLGIGPTAFAWAGVVLAFVAEEAGGYEDPADEWGFGDAGESGDAADEEAADAADRPARVWSSRAITNSRTRWAGVSGSPPGPTSAS